MARDICLSGGEIVVIKALGLSGAAVKGNILVGRLADLEEAEIIDTLDGLITQDLVECSTTELRKIDDVEDAIFKVNAIHWKALREAMHPSRGKEKAGRRQRRA